MILGGLALVVAIAGVTGIFASPASTASCQRLAWAGLPRWPDLQTAFNANGWTVQGQSYSSGFADAYLVGPATSDGTQSSVQVHVTCYGGSEGTDALARLRVASTEAGMTVVDASVGSDGFRINDVMSETFREGNLVGMAALGQYAQDVDLDPAVVALDAAMKRAQAPGGLDIPNATVPPYINDTPAPAPRAGII